MSEESWSGLGRNRIHTRHLWTLLQREDCRVANVRRRSPELEFSEEDPSGAGARNADKANPLGGYVEDLRLPLKPIEELVLR